VRGRMACVGTAASPLAGTFVLAMTRPPASSETADRPPGGGVPPARGRPPLGRWEARGYRGRSGATAPAPVVVICGRGVSGDRCRDRLRGAARAQAGALPRPARRASPSCRRSGGQDTGARHGRCPLRWCSCRNSPALGQRRTTGGWRAAGARRPFLRLLERDGPLPLTVARSCFLPSGDPGASPPGGDRRLLQGGAGLPGGPRRPGLRPCVELCARRQIISAVKAGRA